MQRQFMLSEIESTKISEPTNLKQIEILMEKIKKLEALIQSKEEEIQQLSQKTQNQNQELLTKLYQEAELQELSSELKKKLNFPNAKKLKTIYETEIYDPIKSLHHHIDDNPDGVYQEIVQESIDALFDMKKYQQKRKEYLIQQADNFIRTVHIKTGKSIGQTGSSFIKESAVNAPDISQNVKKILKRNCYKPGKIYDNGDLARDFKNFVSDYLKDLEDVCEKEYIQAHNQMLHEIQQAFNSI